MLTTHVKVRPLLLRDLTAVAAIAEASGGLWDADDFGTLVGQPRYTCCVAEFRAGVVGYLAFERRRGYLVLLDVTVRPQFRRQGVGRTLVSAMLKCLHQDRKCCVARVRESNLPACLFLRTMRFEATKVLRGYYVTEDGYRFTYEVDPLPSVEF